MQQLRREVDERVQVRVGVAVQPARLRVQAGRRHQARADRLDLLDVAEARLVEQVLEVAHQLVEHAQVLAAALVRLVVEVVVVDDLREQHADVEVVLAVLRRALQHVGDVPRDDVVEQPVRLALLLVHARVVDGGALVAVEAEPRADLRLAVQEREEEEQEEEVEEELVAEVSERGVDRRHRGRRVASVAERRRRDAAAAVKDAERDAHHDDDDGDGRQRRLEPRRQQAVVREMKERRNEQRVHEPVGRRAAAAERQRRDGDGGRQSDGDGADRVAHAPPEQDARRHRRHLADEQHPLEERRHDDDRADRPGAARRRQPAERDGRQDDGRDDDVGQGAVQRARARRVRGRRRGGGRVAPVPPLVGRREEREGERVDRGLVEVLVRLGVGAHALHQLTVGLVPQLLVGLQLGHQRRLHRHITYNNTAAAARATTTTATTT